MPITTFCAGTVQFVSDLVGTPKTCFLMSIQGPDQKVWIGRLTCTYIVGIREKQFISCHGLYVFVYKREELNKLTASVPILLKLCTNVLCINVKWC